MDDYFNGLSISYHTHLSTLGVLSIFSCLIIYRQGICNIYFNNINFELDRIVWVCVRSSKEFGKKIPGDEECKEKTVFNKHFKGPLNTAGSKF